MAKDERRQITIGQLMMASAVVSLAISVFVNPGTARTVSVLAGFVGAAFIAVALFIAIVDLGLGVRCPHCGEWTMSRVSLSSFRDRFYRCTACQARCRRGFLRGWDDASGPEFDPIYTRKRPENPWTALPGVEDEDLVYSKTHVHLLLNKQRRNPNPPDQGSGSPP